MARTPSRHSSSGAEKGRELALRLADFGGQVMWLVEEWAVNERTRNLLDQLLRSATAPGAHYGEARSAQSLNDFIHKLALAAKEQRECLHWLRIARRSPLATPDIEPLISEADELTAILFSSLQTARERKEAG